MSVLPQVGKMGDKLKKTEEHLLRLLALRKQQGTADRARARGAAVAGRRLAAATAASSSKEKATTGGEMSVAVVGGVLIVVHDVVVGRLTLRLYKSVMMP